MASKVGELAMTSDAQTARSLGVEPIAARAVRPKPRLCLMAGLEPKRRGMQNLNKCTYLPYPLDFVRLEIPSRPAA